MRLSGLGRGCECVDRAGCRWLICAVVADANLTLTSSDIPCINSGTTVWSRYARTGTLFSCSAVRLEDEEELPSFFTYNAHHTDWAG